jgi:hypothetical protein
LGLSKTSYTILPKIKFIQKCIKILHFNDWLWWFMTLIPAAQGAQIRRTEVVQGQPGQKVMRAHFNKLARYGIKYL